nr:MAG: major capsid protein [Microviridae sp.]
MAGYQLPARKLASQQDSAMIQRPDVPRSKFLGSFTRKTTFNAGLLVPFLVDEVLPGDHLKYDCTAYVRMATPYFPMMDNQRIDTHFFFVPNRLVWANWKKFMGEQVDPGNSIDYLVPTVTPSGSIDWNVGSLWDYFGLIPGGDASGVVTTFPVSALPFRAYNLIYNEWFRDENLINSVPTIVGDGNTAMAGQYVVRRRAKSQDYFTSALPWPQKFTAPSIQSAVSGLGIAAADLNVGTGPIGAVIDTFSQPNNTSYANAYDGVTVPYWMKATAAGYPQVYAEASVNSFRQAFLVQQLLERDARGGTRYTEIVRSHFGVVSPDARQQRPEYIGGGSSAMNITPVAQTTGGAGTVGILGAAATSVGKHMASYASTEHGYIIGLMSVRSELSYGQGIPRTFSRSTRYDFYWPSLAGLGEQAVLRKELFATGVAASDNAVFGYQERWHEYRTRYSEVTGRFRVDVPNTLSAWHLSQNVTTAYTLGQTFVQDSPPMARVLSAGGTAAEQHIEYLADILIQREAVRPLPMFGTPVTLGRF